MSTNDYLSRPLIEGTVFVIKTDHVKITSPCTIYAEAHRIKPLNKADILALYSNVLKNARNQKAKISYKNRYRKKISECWTEYENCCEELSQLFARIVAQAIVVQSRGLHYGTVDDDELEKLKSLSYEHQKYFYGGTAVSLMSEIFHALTNLQSSLSRDSGVLKIYL